VADARLGRGDAEAAGEIAQQRQFGPALPGVGQQRQEGQPHGRRQRLRRPGMDLIIQLEALRMIRQQRRGACRFRDGRGR